MSKKKILFTSNTANFVKFNKAYMKWFREQGWIVHYASPGEEAIPECNKSFAVPFSRSPYNLSNIKAYGLLKKIIDRENYSMIHCHTPMGGVVTRLAALNARKKGTVIMYTSHGFHFYKGAPLKNWLLYFPVEKALSHVTDCLITINAEDFEIAKKFNFHAPDIEMIHGVGVDFSRFYPIDSETKSALRKQYGFSDDDFILIYVAEFIHRKNHSVILKASRNLRKQIQHIKILLAGKGELKAVCEKQASEWGLSDCISFVGYRTDVDQLYRISDIVISSSRQEGLGLNLAEGMACGLPAIGADNRGHKEMIQNGVTGLLFPAENPEKFADCVLTMYNDPILREKFAALGPQVAEKFKLENTLREMETIYKRFM